jgi:hypothetical protein
LVQLLQQNADGRAEVSVVISHLLQHGADDFLTILQDVLLLGNNLHQFALFLEQLPQTRAQLFHMALPKGLSFPQLHHAGAQIGGRVS